MNILKPVLAGAILIGLVFASSTGVMASGNLVKLEVVSPELANNGNAAANRSIQFRAGWPLTLRITVKDRNMLGVGTIGIPQLDPLPWPEVDQGGAIVFDDPDGCYSPLFDNPCIPDETLFEFYPDRDMRGVADTTGNAHQQEIAATTNFRPAFGGPSIYGELATDGGFLLDGWGWGADDDIPGLVILADVGGSLVLQDANFDSDFVPGVPGFWDPVEPRQVRNSAGFINMVGYELSTARGRTSITASMVVPRHLYSNTTLVDGCTGEVDFGPGGEPICSGEPIQRIDGGPVTEITSEGSIDADITIRAFVVANRAPPFAEDFQAIDILEDMNGDGKVGRKDAILAGYTVLSNQVKIKLTQISNSTGFCVGLDTPLSGFELIDRGTVIQADLDGNGYVKTSVVCPGGGGGVGEPPRL